MRQVESWDEYFIGLAIKASSRSKDPNTQVGCIIVNPIDNDPVQTGYNGFTPGVKETKELWKRPQKYQRVIHAEMNAVSRAAKNGKRTYGCTIYTTHFPCLNCAKLIIAAGIKRVVAVRYVDGWDESHGEATQLFNEAMVEWKVGKEENRFYNGVKIKKYGEGIHENAHQTAIRGLLNEENNYE